MGSDEVWVMSGKLIEIDWADEPDLWELGRVWLYAAALNRVNSL